MSGDRQIQKQEVLLRNAMIRAQHGDAAAYRELLGNVRVILQVYTERFLRRMGVTDPAIAEDQLQEILLAVHGKRHTYDSAQLFTPWLFAIARYKLIDYGRRRRREQAPVDLQSVEDTLAAPIFGDPTAASDLKKLMAELPEQSRRALELFKLEELSVAEVAAQTQLSRSAVKVTVHRALKSLRARLRKEEAR